MKIEVKKIVRPIPLREYAEEFGDEAIWVWVNPPRQVRLDYWQIAEEFSAFVSERLTLIEALADEAGEDKTLDELDVPQETRERLEALDAKLESMSRRIYAWFAEMWSQSQDEAEHWTAAQVEEIATAFMETDPRFWGWIQEQHWRLLSEHRDGVKKK